MSRLSLVAVLVCAMTFVAGCQMSGPGKGAQPTPASNAVTGEPIEVTALDAAPGAGPAPVASSAAGTEAAAPQAAAGPEAASAPEATVAAEAAPPAPKPDLAETPVTPKSEQQLACEKKKGHWAKIGKGGARACVYTTRDSGKRCTKESQCEGVCLARSGTCAPVKPMYGCNEIFQDNGARVTLCLD